MDLFDQIKWNYRNRRDHRKAKKLLDKHPELFDEVRTYCFFIGYPRSGHSLVGSLLDAHPHTAIAHEQDALKYIDKGYERKDLFAILLQNAEQIGRKGRQQTGYSYQVPGQYQGEWTKLQVIGDKRGGNSSRWLRDKPELLGKLRETISEELRAIHISRNPFDNIATMAYRHAKGRPERVTEATLRQEKEHYLGLARAAERMRKELNDEEFFHLSNEELLADPSTHLPRMLSFLGLEPFEEHLEACKSILYDSPSRSRERFDWPEDLVEEIEEALEELPLLARYRFRDQEA